MVSPKALPRTEIRAIRGTIESCRRPGQAVDSSHHHHYGRVVRVSQAGAAAGPSVLWLKHYYVVNVDLCPN